MRKRRLLWQIYPFYLLITVIALLAVGWYASRALGHFYLAEMARNLESQARLVKEQIQPSLLGADSTGIDAICKRLGREAGTRVTVILPTGIVIGDSDEDPERMDNHGDRPEVREAMFGQTGRSARYSYTLEKRMMYVAIPLGDAEGIAAVVRLAIPITAIDAVLRRAYIRIAIAGVIIAVLVAAVSLVISRRISSPLAELRRGAERFASGDLGGRLAVPKSDEIGALAEAMNQMAAELDSRIQTIIRQKNQEEAILSSMAEGVLAVDADERVIMLNQQAAHILGAGGTDAEGRSLQEIVRNPDLQQFVSQALSSQAAVESDIALDGGQRYLRAHATVLRDQEGGRMGVLVVLHDVTRLRRLERVRADFVANVSHELKTPITTIKGFVETLLQKEMHGSGEARRFLRIVAKQVDRLNAILEDLLMLSRIEQEADRAEISLEVCDIRPVLEAAVETCRVSASARQIQLDLKCSEPCRARINAVLLEQAVINLIDNAIKYSDPGGIVEVEGLGESGRLTIRVRDRGCGIAEEHLPRLFERFYRVDKARSRKHGGTGLGLAIVKHITLAHGGQVSVESKPGAGSVFSIFLPEA